MATFAVLSGCILRRLAVRVAALGDAGFTALVDGLVENADASSLNKLFLNGNDIGPKSAASGAQLLNGYAARA